jgi:phosphopantetheinyl transferase
MRIPSVSIFYIYRMPLLLRRNIAEQTTLAIWQISEPQHWFRERLMLNDAENAHIDSIRHPQKKLHWLSSRLLIRELLGNPNDFIDLASDERGKPLIRNFPVDISISHSFDLSALLLSERMKVGVDIEKVTEKVERIQFKFMATDELQSLSGKNDREQLYVYWCAKEAMYKWYGKKELDFRAHLAVVRFDYRESGTLTGAIRKGNFLQKLPVHYEKLGEYMMAYTLA